MAINELLSSGRPLGIVFKASLDVFGITPSQLDIYETVGAVWGAPGNRFRGQRLILNNSSNFDDWVGGRGVAQASPEPSIDNSAVVLSNVPLVGLATETLIQGLPSLESSIGKPFDGEIQYTFGSLNILCDPNDSNLHLRDWQNKPYTVEIGYADQPYSTYETWFVGKTLGTTLSNDTLNVTLSTHDPATQLLFPPETFETGNRAGQARPYIIGKVNNIKPIPIDDEGLWQFHSGTTVDTSTQTWVEEVPYIYFDETGKRNNLLSETFAVSGVGTAEFVDNVLTLSPDPLGANTFTSATYLADIDVGTDAVVIGDKIRAEVRARVVFGDDVSESSVVVTTPAGFVTLTRDWKNIAATPKIAATASTLSMFVSAWKGTITGPDFPPNPDVDFTVEVESQYVTYLTPVGEDIKIFTEDSLPALVQVYKVNNAVNQQEPPLGTAFYDTNGFLRLNREYTNFTMNAVGDDETTRSVAACLEIATAAGSGINVTAPFTGDNIGVYYTEQKPVIEQIRALAEPCDYLINQNLADEDLVLARRYNHQPVDFDGNDNDANQFEILDPIIIPGSVRQLTPSQGPSRFNVRYAENHKSPDESKVATKFNPLGNLSGVREIASPFRSLTPAQEIATLVSREAVPFYEYSFSVVGVGHGIEVNQVGNVIHPKIRAGVSHITKVVEKPDQQTTNFEVTVYG